MSSAPSALTDQLVRAGAGAGKTTALVDRVMDLIVHYRAVNKKWPRLVVTTFTRKATQELRERLTVKACSRDDLELLDYCRSRSRLHISTIHGVMGLFLRRYGHLLGIDPSYTILTEGGAQNLRRQILRQVLLDNEKGSEALENYRLNELERMIRDFIEAQAMNPELKPLSEIEILQMQAQQAKAFASDGSRIAAEIRTATSHPKWTEYAVILETVSKFLNNDWTADNWLLINAVWEDKPNKPSFSKTKANEVSGELNEAVDQFGKALKSWLDDPGHSPQTARALSDHSIMFAQMAEEFSRQFKQQKLELGQMEMGDLEYFALQSMRDKPAIAHAFASDWDHWLIDEFQDTSPVQVELLKGLIHTKPRYVVGDPQQSIYLFRGARMEVFSQEEERVTQLGLPTELKLKNYRSTPSLLTFINDFFKTVGDGFQPMEPRNQEFNPEKVVATFHHVTAVEGEGRRHAEYAAIASHVESLLAQPGTELSDICILSRKNKNLLDIAQYLKELGYPTHVHASRGYSGRREVRDALALLKFLAHPADNQNLLELLRSPWCRISDQELVDHLEKTALTYWQQLLQSKLKEHPAIVRLLESQQEAVTIGLSLAWEKALIRFCFIDLSSHHDATGRREANLWKLLASLALAERRPGFKVLEFIDQATSVRDDVESADEGDAVTAVEPNVINLMTVHAAKGLQRRHVIIPHCDEKVQSGRTEGFTFDVDSGRWSVFMKDAETESPIHTPLARTVIQQQNQRELSEQDRLLYVAVTRAQESVFLSWTGFAATNSWAGRWRWADDGEQEIQKDHYRYRVRQETVVPNKYGKKTENGGTVRAPWRVLDGNAIETPTVWSVSALLEKEEPIFDSVAKVQNSVTDRIDKAVVGTHLHRLLEQLRLNPNQDFVRLSQAWFPTQAPRVLNAMNFVGRLKQPPMGQLLVSGHAEWGFQIQLQGSILEGQIDLWGEADDQIWLIDYKSGNPRALEKAMAQLEIYAFALTRFGLKLPIQMAVIYPFHEKVEIRQFGGNSSVMVKFPELR